MCLLLRYLVSGRRVISSWISALVSRRKPGRTVKRSASFKPHGLPVDVEQLERD
jgi:hypothetical protein